jgi:large subunit ribosomal protein L31
MKAEIHPNYHATATVSCACGESYTAGSTKEAVSVELCAACHPFYTGKQKIVDTARRVEKFEARMAAKSDDTVDHKAKEAKKIARAKKRQEKREASEKAEA